MDDRIDGQLVDYLARSGRSLSVDVNEAAAAARVAGAEQRQATEAEQGGATPAEQGLQRPTTPAEEATYGSLARGNARNAARAAEQPAQGQPGGIGTSDVIRGQQVGSDQMRDIEKAPLFQAALKTANVLAAQSPDFETFRKNLYEDKSLVSQLERTFQAGWPVANGMMYLARIATEHYNLQEPLPTIAEFIAGALPGVPGVALSRSNPSCR